jgi:hypothetical protein
MASAVSCLASSGLMRATESGVYRLRPARLFPERGGGKAALLAGVAVGESVTVAGQAERARVAHALAGGVLGPGHPCRPDAALVVNELFGNNVRHSRPGPPGETVTVKARAGDDLSVR